MENGPRPVENLGLIMFNQLYKGRRVLVTGHTGFKGGWLCTWLKRLGAEVCGYSLPAPTEPALFKAAQVAKGLLDVTGDILDAAHLKKVFQDFAPEVVFHLAAQPLVRQSYREPVHTYAVNVMGTLNVLEAAREAGSVRAFVNVTTDKCYENKETLRPYREDDPMGGYDMYSSSKGCVELLSASYRRSFLKSGGFALATARAGNVIGGGDWALDRLLPDCMRALNAGKEINIRNPQAVRPWQFVLEPLGGYLLLGQKLLEAGPAYAEGFNFGPDATDTLTVEQVAHLAVQCYGKGRVRVIQADHLHEAQLLSLDISKAQEKLGWRPSYTARQAVEETVLWYKRFYEGKDVSAFTAEQIEQFEGNLVWKKN